MGTLAALAELLKRPVNATMKAAEDLSAPDPDVAYYGNLLPVARLQSGEHRFAAPTILQEAARGFTAPARAYRGEIAPEDMPGEALNMALNMGGGGLALSRAAGPELRAGEEMFGTVTGPKGARVVEGVRPANENLRTVIDSNFTSGRALGDELVPIESLTGGVGQAADDAARVSKLADKMAGPEGYIERLLVDQDGNVIEGQHRLDALRKLGVDQVPVTRLGDDMAGFDQHKVETAIKNVGKIHSDHVNGIMRNAADMVREAGGVDKALDEYDLSGPFEAQHRAALDAMRPTGNLTMDTASRMARAEQMGMTADVYHGTHSDFPEFDPSEMDIGAHVGTARQAVNRLKSLSNPFSGGRSAQVREGAHVMPLKANIGKSLEMEDVGNWKDSEVLARALKKKGIEVEGLIDDAADVKSQFEHPDDWLESPENRRNLDDLNAAIQDKGFNSVKYKNLVENEHGEQTHMLPDAERQRSLINSEISHIEGKAHERRPKPPEDATSPTADAEMRAFLNSKLEDYLHPHEAARIDELIAKSRAIAADPKSYDDPHSYIVLDPKNIRSRFAKFDPKFKSSSDILASRGGGNIAALAASSPRDDK